MIAITAIKGSALACAVPEIPTHSSLGFPRYPEGGQPTDILDGFHEPGADVRLVVVFHWDTLVLVVSFEVVGAVRGDIEQSRDPQGVKHVSASSMVGTAEVEERKDLHRAPLHQKET